MISKDSAFFSLLKQAENELSEFKKDASSKDFRMEAGRREVQTHYMFAFLEVRFPKSCRCYILF